MPHMNSLDHLDHLAHLGPIRQDCRIDPALTLLGVPTGCARFGRHFVPPWEEQVPGNEAEPGGKRITCTSAYWSGVVPRYSGACLSKGCVMLDGY